MLKTILRKALGTKNIIYIKLYFKSKLKKEALKKRSRFYMQFLKAGDIYFDVGANYGNRIEPIKNANLEIIAIEPQLECVKYLKWRYKNMITIIPYGLGEKEGKKTMYISNAHTLSSFSNEWINATKESGRFSQYNWDNQRDINITTLDNLIIEYGIPQFIKIDVEGYEFEVLKGLSRPIKMISFEYTVPERKISVFDCIGRIKEISGDNAYFNYSIGESMEWALTKWLSYEEIIQEIESNRFLDSGFGDLYAKTNVDKDKIDNNLNS